jgi:hypothetical protein
MIYVSLADYGGVWLAHPDFTPARQDAARDLCARVNALLADLEAEGVRTRANPKTGTLISGETYGGFRPQDCPIGAAGSSHKQGQGLDLFDPYGVLSGRLVMRVAMLVKHGLWMENPAATPTWCHLQTRPAKIRIFIP